MKPCRDGQHSWKVLHARGDGFDVDQVVRWCAYCGAVVIDEETDGRINAGAVMPIRFPQVTLDYGTNP